MDPWAEPLLAQVGRVLQKWLGSGPPGWCRALLVQLERLMGQAEDGTWAVAR